MFHRELQLSTILGIRVPVQGQPIRKTLEDRATASAAILDTGHVSRKRPGHEIERETHTGRVTDLEKKELLRCYHAFL